MNEQPGIHSIRNLGFFHPVVLSYLNCSSHMHVPGWYTLIHLCSRQQDEVGKKGTVCKLQVSLTLVSHWPELSNIVTPTCKKCQNLSLFAHLKMKGFVTILERENGNWRATCSLGHTWCRKQWIYLRKAREGSSGIIAVQQASGTTGPDQNRKTENLKRNVPSMG